MHPAFSIIVFTTFSGLGYGLAAMLGLGLLDPTATATKAAHGVALVLIGSGLLSSTLHLGNPQRAWRAFSQWRSSWLSREGVLALITFVPLTWSAWLCVFEARWDAAPGYAGAALAAVTVFSTSMIYASLKSVDAWHTPLTPASYLGFAAACGASAAAFLAYLNGAADARWLALAAAFLVLLAWGIRHVWRQRLANAPSSSPESATGLGHLGTVRQLDPPHMNDNYLTREMGFRVARKHAVKLWRIALALGCVAPAAIFGATGLSGAESDAANALLALSALVLLMAGIFIERWLFFAEARHAVMNYYA